MTNPSKTDLITALEQCFHLGLLNEKAYSNIASAIDDEGATVTLEKQQLEGYNIRVIFNIAYTCESE